jgi:hypothetical protein
LGYTPYAPAARSAAEFRWSQPDPAFGWVIKPGRFLSAELGNTPMNFDANGLRAMPPLKPGVRESISSAIRSRRVTPSPTARPSRGSWPRRVPIYRPSISAWAVFGAEFASGSNSTS